MCVRSRTHPDPQGTLGQEARQMGCKPGRVNAAELWAQETGEEMLICL